MKNLWKILTLTLISMNTIVPCACSSKSEKSAPDAQEITVTQDQCFSLTPNFDD